MGVSGLFTLTGISALIAVLVVKFVVPPAPQSAIDEKMNIDHGGRSFVILSSSASISASSCFMQYSPPSSWLFQHGSSTCGCQSEHHWWVYLPAVIAGFALMAPPLIFGEKKQAVVRSHALHDWISHCSFVLFCISHSFHLGNCFPFSASFHRLQCTRGHTAKSSLSNCSGS